MSEQDEVAPAGEATEEGVTSEEKVSPQEGQVQDPPAEGDDADPSAEPEEVSKSKARRDRRKAERDRLRQDAREAEDKLARSQERLTKAEEAGKKNIKPKESDFEDHQEYLVALGAFHAARAMDERSVQDAKDEADASAARVDELRQQAQTEAATNWQMQVEEARGRYKDFDAVISAPDLPITPDMAFMMASSERGADVAYHLGTHPAEAAQIAQMPPIEQAMALGRLEAQVVLPKPKTQSDAPDPINTVKGRAPANKSPESMSYSDYVAARKAGKI